MRLPSQTEIVDFCRRRKIAARFFDPRELLSSFRDGASLDSLPAERSEASANRVSGIRQGPNTEVPARAAEHSEASRTILHRFEPVGGTVLSATHQDPVNARKTVQFCLRIKNRRTRALSLVRLKRSAHNRLSAGSNPAGPIHSLHDCDLAVSCHIAPVSTIL